MRRPVKHLGSGEDTKKLARGELPVSRNVPPNTKELGEVLSYSQSHNSYTVITRGTPGDPRQPGGRQLRGVCQKSNAPGQTNPLPVGTVVIVDWSFGFPYIDGVLPINASRAQIESGPGASSNIGGESSVALPDDNTQQEHSGYYRDPTAPKDALPGDQVLSSPDGNRIGALRGGYNVMDGGPGTKAKVETFGDRDLTRITSEDFELLTGFGVYQVYNAEGRCGVSIRGAADQLTESGGSDDQWTFKVDIGDTGDFFAMEICTADGATQAKFHITPNGRVTLIATDGLNWVDGGKTASYQEYAANLFIKILGQLKKKVAGAVTEEFQSTRTTQISETDQRSIGHNEIVSVNNNRFLNVGGNQEIKVSGGTPLTANPLNVAVNMSVLNGSYFLELGNPLAGASPAAMAGFTVAVNNGDITLGQNPDPLALPATKATVSLNTLLPNSVALGGTASPLSNNPAFMHAVMFEPLMSFLAVMMALFDSHIHIPPIIGPPVTLMSPSLSSMLATIMSTRVIIGG